MPNVFPGEAEIRQGIRDSSYGSSRCWSRRGMLLSSVEGPGLFATSVFCDFSVLFFKCRAMGDTMGDAMKRGYSSEDRVKSKWLLDRLGIQSPRPVRVVLPNIYNFNRYGTSIFGIFALQYGCCCCGCHVDDSQGSACLLFSVVLPLLSYFVLFSIFVCSRYTVKPRKKITLGYGSQKSKAVIII